MENAEKPSTNIAISSFHTKELLKILKAVAKTEAGKNFRAPVLELWPGFAGPYAEKISNPVDLKTMKNKLEDGEYASMDAFKADVHLIYDNTVTFNGIGSSLVKLASEVEGDILRNIDKIPHRR